MEKLLIIIEDGNVIDVLSDSKEPVDVGVVYLDSDASDYEDGVNYWQKLLGEPDMKAIDHTTVSY